MALTPKIISCGSLFVVTFFFGILPCCILRMVDKRTPKSNSHQKYISWMNCFAGGVFFGTTFLHLMPESLEELQKGIIIDFPIGEVIISCGFFLVLFLEHLFGVCFVSCRNVSLFTNKKELKKTSETKENEYELDAVKSSSSPHHENVVQSHVNGHIGQVNRSFDSVDNVNEETPQIETIPENTREAEILPDSSTNGRIVVGSRMSSFANRSFSDHVYEDIGGVSNGSETSKISVFRATVLIVALSFHMIFEGLALGLQETLPAVWTLLIVISVHKCIVAVSVGLNLNGVMRNLKHISFCLFLFSLVTPVGIVTGILINDLTSTENIVSGILECVATGSFLYVTFFEILQREFNEQHNLMKVMITILGYGVTTGAKLLEKYYH